MNLAQQFHYILPYTFMFFIPKELPSHLEFIKIVDLLSKGCISEVSVLQLQQFEFSTDVQVIGKWLDQVAELKELIGRSEDLPLQTIDDIRDDLELLEKEGYVLEVEAIQRIRKVIDNYRSVYDHLTKKRDREYQQLLEIVRDLKIDSDLKGMIGKVLDPEGEIRQDASPELSKIYKSIASREKEAFRIFNRIAGELKNLGLLTMNTESIKNGRRVLSVPAEYKRRIKGIILDESASGKTVFIEPEEVVSINNAITELELEKRKEIYRLLRELCAKIRPHIPLIKCCFQKIMELDVIRSKSLLAISMEAKRPNLASRAGIHLIQARHPLLYLKNKSRSIKTIPFNLDLNDENRIVVISGPNAGGKSVTLKAVGLIHLMCQTGCLVPVDENSTIGVFHKLFCDIGDQQSLEDDLSTYSFRLNNMNSFMKHAGSDCLILIDEFGTGTDPKIGGAIAEAILHELNSKKAFGVITTHYSNIKMYAHNTKGIINGAMIFDQHEMKPSYELELGRPGSSFAFEIAKRVGLKPAIIQYARKRSGAEVKNVDDLLTDLQKEKSRFEKLIAEAKEKENSADRLIKNYKQLLGELEIKRKKLKLDQKYVEIQAREEARKDFESALKEIRKEKDESKARKALKESVHERKKLLEEARQLKEDIYSKESKDTAPLKAGDFVKLKTGSMIGEIVRIDKTKADLLVGNLKMRVPVHELVPSREPLEINAKKGVNTKLVQNSDTQSNKLDIRGYRKSEAIKSIDEFIDQALVQNLSFLEIIHGKGNGVLKKLVHKKLSEYTEISEFGHPEEEFGGIGITYVKL